MNTKRQVDQLMERFTEYLVKQGHSETTCYEYSKHVRNYLTYMYNHGFDPENAKMATQQVLNDYIHQVNGNKLPHLVEASINKYYRYKHIIFGEPLLVFSLDMPRPNKLMQYVPSALEIEKICRACNKISNAKQKLRTTAIVQILRSTAIREMELRNIKLPDIDLSPDKERILIHGKGRKERYVPLDRRAVRHLRRYLEAHEDKKTQYLFYSRLTYGRLQHNTIHFIFKDLKKKAGIADEVQITPHSIRRFQATQLADKGVSVWLIRSFLGHSNIATTSQYVDSHSTKALNAIRDMENSGEEGQED